MRLYVVMIFIISGISSLNAQDTELKLYRPFGEAEQQAPLIIKEKHEGHCWQQSQRIKREDAWRCTGAGKTYDPCFIKQYSSKKEALCPQSPWVGDSVALELASSADNSQHALLDMSKAYPWALELSSGEKCQAVDEERVFDGMPIHYQCNTQSVLMGHLQRCKSVWTILQRRGDGQVETVNIVKAWF
ncbi:MAG: hypothetical protein Q8M03_12890 [Legionella sp.]|nr:hypothetical protein [Legionella sp.]